MIWCLLFFMTLTSSATGQSNAGLNVTGVRLAGGDGPFGGRVEVKVNGVWGTICDNNFDWNDANVLCKMMNLTASTYTGNAQYGQGQGPIFATNLRCTGTETHIQMCPYDTITTCTHAKDVSIICTKCGYINVAQSESSTITSDGTTLSVECTRGFYSNETGYCNTTGIWLPSSLKCKPEKPITPRLVNGLGLYDGRLEINLNGTWGDVCSNSFAQKEADAICNMLFSFPVYKFLGYKYYYYYNYGYNTHVHIDYIDCNGNEASVGECNFNLISTCTRRVALICNAYPLDITGARLVDGPSLNDGRLELQYNNTWGTVCNKYLSEDGANTLCRMLNASLTWSYKNAKYGSGTGPVLIGELFCDSNSSHVHNCSTPYTPPDRQRCSNSNIATLICTACGRVTISNGEITSSNGSIMTVTCNTGYVPTTYTIECLSNGTWSQNETCKVFGYPLNVTGIRLVNGVGLYDGRLEVQVNGTSWGTVCSNSFDASDAQVVCNILFGSTKYRTYTTYYYGAGTGPIYIDKLYCTGSESSIDQCKYNVLNTCSHSNDVAVVCNAAPLNITDIRLVNGTSPQNGRVELLVDDVWGTVCNYIININIASTLCNMMNLSLLTYYTTPVYGIGSGPTHIQLSSCGGSYSHISQCSYYTPYKGHCTKSNDLSLACTDNRPNITDIRLKPGPYHGRVEIEINGTWGTICGYSFNDNDGRMICHVMNGTNLRWSFSYAYYGEGTGPVHINQLSCTGNEQNINECSYIYDNSCGHDRDASVLCYGPDLNITGVRLADGTGPYDGRAEIEVNGTWGTICDQNFDINDADAFCNMLGLSAAQYFTGATHGKGKGPVHIDELFCSSRDTDLSDCPYLNINSCNHARDVSVVCNECGQPDIYYWDIGYFSYHGTTLFADCAYYRTYTGTLNMTCDNITKTWVTAGECQEYSFPLDIDDIRLANGSSSRNGRVEIKSLGTWGTICHDEFGMNEAHTICRMLNMWPAVEYKINSKYGAGTGPIFVDNLNCGTEATHINNCTYATYDDCNHDNDVSVVCLDCGDPKPMNGMVNSTKTTFGAVVKVSCITGYRLEGNDTILCEMSGNWSESPYCELIDCKSPQPENGAVNSSTTTNGTIVSVTCNTGYNLSGDATIMCQSNDQWTDYPVCEILDCGIPTPENAEVDLPSNATTYGSIAVISCNQGYLPDGSSTSSCLENGQWDVIPSCEIIDCGNPTPHRGFRNSTSTVYGAVVEITCDHDIEIKGDPVIECQLDGTWTHSPVCDENDCGRPSVPNSQVDVSNGTTSGSIATIACNEGYDLVGSTSVVCTGTGWNDTSLECTLQDCGTLSPENGKLISITGTTYGETATIECNEGHEMEGDSTVSCEDGGRWSSATTCTIRDCGSPVKLTNGDIVDSTGTVFNSSVTFSCDGGYLLVGEKTLHCQSDGTWSNDIPSCVQLANIGESCQTSAYCKTHGAVCSDSVCVCQTRVHDSRTDKCDTMPLFPYGLDAKDKELNGSGCVRQKFSPGVPFFGTTYTKLFVCRHGVVSFGRRYKKAFEDFNKKGKIWTLIAPFHATIKSGKIWYRRLDVDNKYELMMKRADEVKQIEEHVRLFGSVDSFEAAFILIATWENVLPESAYFDNVTSEGSTFQLVLASNGENTFCYYIYPNGLLKWAIKSGSNRHHFAPVWIGHNSTENIFFTHRYSFETTALTIDTNVMHRGVSGVVFKSLVETPVKNKNVGCVRWYQKNKQEKQHIDLMNSWLPQCPCDISLARWDPWFWHIGRWHWWKNFTCVDMLPGRIYRPYGKSCCYDYRTLQWVDIRPIAGGFYRYHPENEADHYIHDIVSKEMCCSPFSTYCKHYYDLRPTGTCYRESPYNFGSFWGDPHFRTLDGLNFTFNGLGEYILLQVQTENNTFSLQARTERAIKEDGNLSDATVFSAFAAMDETNASVHVEVNRAKKGFNIYGNGIDLTQKYNQKSENDDPTLQVPGGTLFVSKRGETLVVLFPSSGISLNISVSVEMLSLSTIVPTTLANVTSGLLGNYNGNPEDDFTLPNGTVLRSNLTEREVFSYGQKWEIDGENSAFMYQDDKDHRDHHNATYVPRFLDEADSTKRQEAEVECGGSENIECVFDLVFTENKDVGLATKLLKTSADIRKKEMDEVVPYLSGCGSIETTVGQKVYCPVVIEDGDSVEFLANNVNATYDQNMKSISYFQSNTDPVDIRVVARNENGRPSVAFIVSVLLCTGCNGHGTCTDFPREDPRNNDYFQYLTCECQSQYEGLDCENVFDGCEEEPCSLGRNCTSLNVTEQIQLKRTYLCDVCPEGYVSYDSYNDICSDIDECESKPCDHACLNTEGSYECTCFEGYRVDTRDINGCTDINECEDLNTPHNCLQNCSNTDGSFVCSCYKGFTMDDLGKCTPDTTSENLCSLRNCSSDGGCMLDDEDNPVCFCNNGFELTGDNLCEDIDECSRNACPQECNNYDGGFECICFAGYTLERSTTCQECDIGFWGENCQNECQCNGEGVKSCDHVKGCICEDGWQGDACDDDIDECFTRINVCDDTREVCENSPGSFQCKCLEGFAKTLDGQCEDVDECSIPILNTCNQTCVNAIGSYSCECSLGFTAIESTCQNIDECALQTHDCEQLCDDNPGSYNCYCYYGYILNDDRKTCTELSDPCLSIHNLNCSHYCFISTDDAECRCQDGYFLGSDYQTCTDIDECSDGRHVCDVNAECKNTEGSYTCECPIGLKLENDGRTCSDCDGFHYGKDCKNNCSCLHGVCDKVHGCDCESGWRGNNCDIDFDECDTKQLECSMPNEVCVNTPGSAVCGCLDGYVRTEDGQCKDVDECSDSRLNTCDQTCVNLPGDYKCECKSGFLFLDGKCQDINECENKKSDCEQLCENTLGSYRCYCEDGFKLNQTDRVSCTPASGCMNALTCGEHSICYKHNGVDTCLCMNGFQNVSGQCEDINECELSPSPCSGNCDNTQGGYECTCGTGLYLTKDSTTCKECEAGTFGDDCAQNCECNVENSDSCDHITGFCTCKMGWEGATCESDIDECKNMTLCPDHSTCSNTEGGYDCICDIGFFKTAAQTCTECDDTHFGENCAEECTCVQSNTVSCHPTSGHCECNKEWTGADCSIDVDECDQAPDKCMAKEHSTCKNTLGSYKCMCQQGFSEIEDQCVDIDECMTGNHDCSQECVNTMGNYTCRCWTGYQGHWNDCEVCTNHTYGENCHEKCVCVLTNTIHVETGKQSCDRVDGLCRCLPNWKGDRCEEDVDECENLDTCKSKPNSGCVNIIGWYQCECYSGFKQVGDTCVRDDTTTVPNKVSAIRFNFDISIMIDLPHDLDFNVPSTYNTYHTLVLSSLKGFYTKFTSADLVIQVSNLRKGSLIVSYSVQYDDNDIEVVSALVKATKELADSSEFTFNGVIYEANITTDLFEINDSMCNILQSVGTCKLENCVEKDNSVLCEMKGLTTPHIIGIAAGGSVFVLIVVSAIVMCMRRRVNSKKQPTKQGSLPKNLNKKNDFDQLGNELQNQSDDEDARYRSWGVMLTQPIPKLKDNILYDEPYKIPRAHVRQPTKISTNKYS